MCKYSPQLNRYREMSLIDINTYQVISKQAKRDINKDIPVLSLPKNFASILQSF